MLWLLLFAFFASWASGVKSNIMLIAQESWRIKLMLEALVIVLFVVAGLLLRIGM